MLKITLEMIKSGDGVEGWTEENICAVICDVIKKDGIGAALEVAASLERHAPPQLAAFFQDLLKELKHLLAQKLEAEAEREALNEEEQLELERELERLLAEEWSRNPGLPANIIKRMVEDLITEAIEAYFENMRYMSMSMK